MTLLAVPQSQLIRQLQTYRLKVGLSQADIAWKLGFSVPTVSRWERGVATPDLRAIGAIVDFLRRADAHTEKALIRAVMSARDSRNLWEEKTFAISQARMANILRRHKCAPWSATASAAS
ncbi:helix-turn-helix transcriptional regulator [Rhizobium sp. 32-5/1]|uniref:helix-turn-helix domain-containing protein n=1 Tax=Rhizobium sp. 32-5/1 TaxID=3019602 RepID=UPI00240D0BDA|nr:helix-turn-helix transcriptional regulator [Rhizobium sp. 32-5/1]WEZ84267.1 helix-turn-helix transcriptional regulator [Rhizobium sp. 32-5/1]